MQLKVQVSRNQFHLFVWTGNLLKGYQWLSGSKWARTPNCWTVDVFPAGVEQLNVLERQDCAADKNGTKAKVQTSALPLTKLCDPGKVTVSIWALDSSFIKWGWHSNPLVKFLEGIDKFIYVNHIEQCLEHSKDLLSAKYYYVLLKNFISFCFPPYLLRRLQANSSSALLPSQAQYYAGSPPQVFFTFWKKEVSSM